MRLEEKIHQRIKYHTGLYKSNLTKEISELADEFTIEFAEWIAINDYRFYSNGWSKVFKKGNITSKEILEIYKKEKGL